MQRQEFSYKFIENVLKDYNLKVISIPLCSSRNLYSHIIYDYRFKDILYILRRIYEVNFFNEKDVMEKYCDNDSLNYILRSETNVPAIAIVNAYTFDMEVEKSLIDLSTSKYLPIFQDMFLILDEILLQLQIRNTELEEEYDKLDITYKRLKDAAHPVVELINIYKKKLKTTPLCKIKERKKWKEAINYFNNSKDQGAIVKKELLKLNDKLKDNIESRKNCNEEILCLLECKEYLGNYVSKCCVEYMGALSGINKTTMEAAYERQERTYNYNRNYNGGEVFNS